MLELSPGVSLTHGAVEEVLQLLSGLSSPKESSRAEPNRVTAAASPVGCTGSLPCGMRAWIEGDVIVVEAGPLKQGLA